MVLRICILGNTLKDAERLLGALCEANADGIYRRRHDVGIMNDGTELIAVSASGYQRMCGHRFDQVFYERRSLFSYCVSYCDAIEYLRAHCLGHSAVPNEFQWCAVDMDI
jgi:hypothetical protein